MPSRKSFSHSKKQLKDSGFFSDEQIDTLVTLPTLEAALFLVRPFLPAGPAESKEG
jgi:hypothetical protein